MDQEESNQKDKTAKIIVITAAVSILLTTLLLLGIDKFILKRSVFDAPPETSSHETGDPAVEEPPAAAETSHYSNETCNLSFDYPSAWGSVTIENFSGSAGTSGFFKTGSFSGKPDFSFGIISHDWRESRGRGGSFYDGAGWKRFGEDFYTVTHNYVTGELQIGSVIEGATSHQVMQGVNARALKSKFPHSEFFDTELIQTRYNLDGPNCYGVIFVLTDITATHETEYNTWVESVEIN
jgi:hypothetical protein